MKRSNKLIHTFIIAVLFVIISIFYVMTSSAQVHAYQTTKWDTNVKVNKDYTFDYTETIEVNFDYPQHGIFRYIPFDGKYRIKNIKVEGDPYDVDTDDGEKVIKIGSASQTITGKKTYKISYTLKYVEDHYSNADLMYIDLVPTEWNTSIDEVSFHMDLPDDFDTQNFSFYTGGYGLTEDLEDHGTLKIDDEKKTVDFKGYIFPSYCGITVYKTLPDGYWNPTISYEWVKYVVLAMLVLILLYIGFKRITVGRDPQIVETVEFYPPEGLSPMEIGYYIDGTVDQKDITSSFFYLADKGYIRIHETSKKSFKFEKLKTLEDGSNKALKKFFKAIFGTSAFKETEVPVIKRSSDIKERLGKAYGDIPALVIDHFKGEDSLYSKASEDAEFIGVALHGFGLGMLCCFDMLYYSLHVESIIFVIFVVVFATAIPIVLEVWMISIHNHRRSRMFAGTTWRMVLASFLYFLYCVVVLAFVSQEEIGFANSYISALTVIFMVLGPVMLLGMKARTEKSARILGQVLGFKNFIRTAELDKLNELVEENPNYFYNILPYAYVFGLTKKWASNFESIHVDNPDWYVSPTGGFNDINRFNVVAMNHMFDSMNRTISDAVASTSDHGSSGGGGFSGGGGGFSGGGGGGGGGGAW